MTSPVQASSFMVMSVWVPKDPIYMTYIPEGPKDPNWKFDPGYFCWVRRTIDGPAIYGFRSFKEEADGILCLALIPPNERALCVLPVEPCPPWLNEGIFWRFNGVEALPTLRNSVDFSAGGIYPDGFHGWITDGIIALDKPEGT